MISVKTFRPLAFFAVASVFILLACTSVEAMPYQALSAADAVGKLSQHWFSLVSVSHVIKYLTDALLRLRQIHSAASIAPNPHNAASTETVATANIARPTTAPVDLSAERATSPEVPSHKSQDPYRVTAAVFSLVELKAVALRRMHKN